MCLEKDLALGLTQPMGTILGSLKEILVNEPKFSDLQEKLQHPALLILRIILHCCESIDEHEIRAPDDVQAQVLRIGITLTRVACLYMLTTQGVCQLRQEL